MLRNLIFRTYPKEFNITKEIVMSFALHYCINWYYELIVNQSIGRPDEPPEYQRCVLGIFTVCASADILRMIAFFISLLYCTRKCYGLFPLPFTWIFRDLSKFIFEPLCLSVFSNYLHSMERDKSRYLDQIMQLYLKSFKAETNEEFAGENRQNYGTFLMKEDQAESKKLFLEYINKL